SIVSRADSLVIEFLPTRPRAAKRLLNQVRLMISIAIARGLFVLPGGGEGTEEEKAKHENLADRVGKWLVLRERWPEVALAIEKDLELIERVEDLVRQDDLDILREGLKSSGIDEVEDLEIMKRLLSREPLFEDMAE